METGMAMTALVKRSFDSLGRCVCRAWLVHGNLLQDKRATEVQRHLYHVSLIGLIGVGLLKTAEAAFEASDNFHEETEECTYILIQWRERARKTVWSTGAISGLRVHVSDAIVRPRASHRLVGDALDSLAIPIVVDEAGSLMAEIRRGKRNQREEYECTHLQPRSLVT